jgi:methionine-rich copper-binding protein CopC
VGRLARNVAVIAAAAVAVLGVATPAFAHSRLEAAAPAAGAAVTTPLDQVTLTFNEAVRGKFSTVVVRDAAGRSWSDGAVSVVDDDVHQAVYPLRSGAYTVAWRVVSADGHPVTGEYHFSVALPAALEPSSGPPSPPPAAKPAKHGFLWALIPVLLILAAAIPLLRANRKLKESESQPERRDQEDL